MLQQARRKTVSFIGKKQLKKLGMLEAAHADCCKMVREAAIEAENAKSYAAACSSEGGWPNQALTLTSESYPSLKECAGLDETPESTS